MGHRFEDFLAQHGRLSEGEFVARFTAPLLLSEGAAAGGTGRFAAGAEPTRKLEKLDGEGLAVTGSTPPPAAQL